MAGPVPTWPPNTKFLRAQVQTLLTAGPLRYLSARLGINSNCRIRPQLPTDYEIHMCCSLKVVNHAPISGGVSLATKFHLPTTHLSDIQRVEVTPWRCLQRFQRYTRRLASICWIDVQAFKNLCMTKCLMPRHASFRQFPNPAWASMQQNSQVQQSLGPLSRSSHRVVMGAVVILNSSWRLVLKSTHFDQLSPLLAKMGDALHPQVQSP